MGEKLTRVLRILLIMLMGLSVVFTVIFYMGTNEFTADTDFATQINILGWRLEIFMNWAFGLLGVAIAISLIFPIANMITNPASSKKTLLLIGVMAIILGIGWALSSAAIPTFPGAANFFSPEETSDPAGLSKNVGTVLWTTYILGIVALGSILFNEVSKVFK